MSEKSQYPYGRDFCSYKRIINLCRIINRRYGYGYDENTGSIGLFVEDPVRLKSGRYSKVKKHPVLMRSTGQMFHYSTAIKWKD